MTYKLTRYDNIRRISDNTIIPKNDLNSDYIEYLKWIEEGNTPLPEDPPIIYEDWRGFTVGVSTSSTFQFLRSGSMVDIGINALATELRILLSEASLGISNKENIQQLLSTLIPLLSEAQINELNELFIRYNIPLTLT